MLIDSLASYVERITQQYEQIPSDRKNTLQKLAVYVRSRKDEGEVSRLVFICTHNSRRSHLAQIWAQVAAEFYRIPKVYTYSGGTEATAFNFRAVKAMEKAGFRISKLKEGENPVYEVGYQAEGPGMQVFSKRYDEEGNPAKDFAAIMTCTHADENCPQIPGASFRLSIPYNDPKDFDGTPLEMEKYKERSEQIAREMFFAFSQVGI